jgi:hypothetical protein
MAELIGLNPTRETVDGEDRIRFRVGYMQGGSYRGFNPPETNIVLEKTQFHADKTGQSRHTGKIRTRTDISIPGPFPRPVSSIYIKADGAIAQYLTQSLADQPWPTALCNISNGSWSVPLCPQCGDKSFGDLSLDCGGCMTASFNVAGEAEICLSDGSRHSGRIQLHGAPEVSVDGTAGDSGLTDCLEAFAF